MKYLKEIRLGSEHLTTSTFRPTESEQAVLFNISQLSSSDRPITKQDAINVPEETIDQKSLDERQLASAFDQLVTLNLLSVDDQGLITLTDAGQQEVDQIEQSRDFEEPKDYEGGEGEDDLSLDLDGEEGGDLGVGADDEMGGEEQGPEMTANKEKQVKRAPMEGLTLLRTIVEQVNTKESLKKLCG